MNIAIIGATGWIGSTLMQEALSRQLPVTALVRDSAKLSGELAGQVTARVVDLEQGIDPQVFEGIDLVIASVGGREIGRAHV